MGVRMSLPRTGTPALGLRREREEPEERAQALRAQLRLVPRTVARAVLRLVDTPAAGTETAGIQPQSNSSAAARTDSLRPGR